MIPFVAQGNEGDPGKPGPPGPPVSELYDSVSDWTWQNHYLEMFHWFH